MTDLFLSYKAEDRARVAPLVQALETDGLSVWWDAHIGAGDTWRETILRNLESARAVIVVWSRRSVGPKGEFVRDEATRAKRRGAYLPIRIDKVDPPLGFGETQALDLTGWKGDRADPRYQAVLGTIRLKLGIKARRPDRVSLPESGISRRTLVTGGTVAAAAIAGGGAWLLLRPAAAKSDSIAVMPFANLSGDPGQAYFSDGIAEELRNALTRIAGLKVVARTSSEAVRNEDVKEAAHKLGVDNVLTGSVRRSPQTIRISAQLIDGLQGVERWSEVYDRPAGDALQIQSDIAQRVVSALALQLAPVGPARLAVGGTQNPQAHDLFLKGVALRQSGHNIGNLTGAMNLFDGAIRLDPHYADAYALKAIALTELTSGFSLSGPEFERGFARAAAIAQHAIKLSPDLAYGHLALASVFAARLEFKNALAEFRKAMSLNGSDAVILGDYGRFLGNLGLAAEALPLGQRLISVDPLNGRSYSVYSVTYFSQRRYPEAIQIARQVLKLVPGATPPLIILGDSLMLLGKYDEARATYEQIAAGDVFRLTSEGILDERLGHRDASAQAAQKLEALYHDAASFQLAELRAQRGEKDAAFAALDEGMRVRDPGLINLRTDPFLDPLRTDPRYQALVNRLDFPT